MSGWAAITAGKLLISGNVALGEDVYQRVKKI